MKETWRPVPGHETHEVSNLGRVRSWCKGKGLRKAGPLLRKPQRDENGYLRVPLDGKRYRVHRLVLLAFVGPAPRGYAGAHLNGNPADNRLSNLQWVTYAENNEHKRIHGTLPLGSQQWNSKLTEADVVAIRKSSESQAVLAMTYGVAKATIGDVLHGRTWRHVA